MKHQRYKVEPNHSFFPMKCFFNINLEKNTFTFGKNKYIQLEISKCYHPNIKSKKIIII